MTTPTPPLLPLAPHLAPMAEAMAAAETAAKDQVAQKQAEAQAVIAARAEAQQREDDAFSIRNAFKRGGLKMAKAVGRTYGWHGDEVEELFREKPKGRKGKEGVGARDEPGHDGGGDGGGGGGGGDTPADEDGPRDEEEPPAFKLKKNPVKKLPEDCPVIPLGINDGVCFYLSVTKQLRAMETHSAEALRGLFAGRIGWLWGFIPKFKENTGTQNNWDAARTADSLIEACGKHGNFDPRNRVRGVGAWRAEDGGLILHCGDSVFDGAEWREPGFIGRIVYPGDEPLPKPAAAAPVDGEINWFLSLLDSWNWTAETDIDGETGAPLDIDGSGHRLSSLLVLGWIMGGICGGAQKWRPMIWLTGDAASGKSTLQEMIALVMGPSLVSSSDATSAGIYQTIGHSSRACGIDEAEADPFSAKMKGMIELVRQSASGGMILRGSNDPSKVRGFTARSAFFLSSIVIPPLFGQDLTRISILPLGPLKTTTPPKMDAVRFAGFGAALRKRLLDNWSRFDTTLHLYRAELARLGHDGRGCDQIGGLLALSDMARFGEAGADTDTVAMLCAPFTMAGKPRADTTSEQMLNWLITISLDVFRGGTRMTIGTLVAAAAGLESIVDQTPLAAAHALQAHGVYVEGLKDDAVVTLPNQSAGLARLLEGSAFGTKPGAAISGWQQAMQRLATARRPDGRTVGQKVNSRRVGGRGWSLPVKVFLRTDEE